MVGEGEVCREAVEVVGEREELEIHRMEGEEGGKVGIDHISVGKLVAVGELKENRAAAGDLWEN